LVELQNKLAQSQTAADKSCHDRELALNKTISDTQKTIDQLTSTIATDKARVAKLNSMIAQAVANLKQYGDQLTSDKNNLIALGVRRNQDVAAYKDAVSQHQNLITALKQVIAALTQLIGSVESGRPKHVRAIAEETRDEGWTKTHPAKLLELFTEKDINMFLQVAEQADQDSLAKLIALLNQLLSSTKKSLADDHVGEDRSLKTYNQLVTKINTDIGLLNTAIKKQTDNLNSYKKELNELNVTINTLEALLQKNIAYRDSNIAIRTQQRAKCEADTRQRQYEMKIIAKIRKVVEQRLASMSTMLKSRVD